MSYASKRVINLNLQYKDIKCLEENVCKSWINQKFIDYNSKNVQNGYIIPRINY